MSVSLDYEMLSDGSIEYRRAGVLVGTIKPAVRTRTFWVTMALEGMSWSSMPVRSIEAGGYLILASLIEYDADQAHKAAGEADNFCKGS